MISACAGPFRGRALTSALFLLPLFPWALVLHAGVEEQVVDFESAVTLSPDGKANRIPQLVENGVTFTLARQPQQSKGKGLLMFFTHLSNGHKGIASAMATEA